MHQPPSNRLAKTDAPCVQIMHCSVGSRGVSIKNFTGTVDFYLEGGVYQRQCIGNDREWTSHFLAFFTDGKKKKKEHYKNTKNILHMCIN